MFRGLFEGEGGEGGSGGAGAGSQGGSTGTIFQEGAGTQAAAGAGSQAAQGAQSTPGQGSQSSQGAQSSSFSWGKLVGEDGNFSGDWTNQLPDELKSAAESLKVFKSPLELMRSYHSTKVLLGQKGNTVSIPDANSKPEVVSAYRKAIGAPDTPEGYDLKRPADLPANIPWSDDMAKGFGELFLKHNVPKAAAAEFLAKQIEYEKAEWSKVEAVEKQYVADGVLKLRGEWGDAFNSNLAKAAVMAKHGGMSLDHDAMKHPEVISMLYKFHRMIASEDGRTEGASILQPSPGAEADRIQGDPAHPLHKLYQSGDAQTVAHLRALREREEQMRPKK